MREEAQRWLEQAEEDLETGGIIFREKRYYAASYFAQQAAEKALKAVLVRRKGELPARTHDLRQLAKQVKNAARVVARTDQIIKDLSPL